MTLNWKALRRGVLVAAVVALLSSLMVASVSAQPPTPPNRFFGNVTLDGSPAPAGTNVTATIGGNVCGQTTVKADSTYVLDVVSSGQTAGCGTEGASVSFTVGGSPAGSASWSSGKFSEQDLAGQAAPPTVVPPTVAPVTPTPKVVTGTGGYLDGGSGSAWWAYMAAGLGLLLLGTAGAAAYRRLRP
jgi:opacity protein-like surface antigen